MGNFSERLSGQIVRIKIRHRNFPLMAVAGGRGRNPALDTGGGIGVYMQHIDKQSLHNAYYEGYGNKK